MRVQFLIIIICFTNLFGQNLKESDYSVDSISIGGPISDILQILSKPISVKSYNEPKTGGIYFLNGKDTLLPPSKYYVYEFDSLTIKVSEFGFVERFDYVTKKFVTARGIRIGDSEQKVRELYGIPSENDFLIPWVGEENIDDVLPYFEGNSTTGISFYLKNGVVVCISVGQGFC